MLSLLPAELLQVRVVAPRVCWFRYLGAELVVLDWWLFKHNLAKVMTQHLSELDLVLRDHLLLSEGPHFGGHPLSFTKLDVIDPRSLRSILGPEVLARCDPFHREIILNQI